MTDIANDAEDTGRDVIDTAKKAVGEQTLLAQAQEAVTDAFDATVSAVKEHPIAAVAIATGAAAAVAGAVLGAGKLLGGEDAPTNGAKKS